MQESIGYRRGRTSRSRGTGRLPPSLARREAALRSRAPSHPRRLTAGFSDGRSWHAPAWLTRTSQITRHKVDAEPSLRAPSGIPDVGVLTRRLASGTTAAAGAPVTDRTRELGCGFHAYSQYPLCDRLVGNWTPVSDLALKDSTICFDVSLGL